jgi:hypothetical protein
MMRNVTVFLAALMFSSYLAGCGRQTKALRPDAEAEPQKMTRLLKPKATPEGKEGNRPRAKAKAGPKGKVAKVVKPALEPEAARDGFSLPEDGGGRLLATMLPPHRNGPSSSGFATGPRRLPVPPSLNGPDLSLPPSLAELPRPPLGPEVKLRPRPVGGDGPLGWLRSDPSAPEARGLPDARRVRLPGRDVDRPPPLPLLGTPLTDRAPLSDPAEEISRAAALAGSVSPRSMPVPFVRLNLPDPFENRKQVRLRKPPEEELPANVGSKPPR